MIHSIMFYIVIGLNSSVLRISKNLFFSVFEVNSDFSCSNHVLIQKYHKIGSFDGAKKGVFSVTIRWLNLYIAMFSNIISILKRLYMNFFKNLLKLLIYAFDFLFKGMIQRYICQTSKYLVQ